MNLLYDGAADGAPQFEPVEGVPDLQYAVNASLPVIESAPDSFYCVQNGIWFAAPTPAGPWVVATAVPPAIYSIPPSCPLHYVTYCRIYGFTPQSVYVGYTPGYLGTVVSADGVVVYGTGYRYRPRIGRVWIAAAVHVRLRRGLRVRAGYGIRVRVRRGHLRRRTPEPYWGPYDWGWRHHFNYSQHQRQSRGPLRALERQRRLDPAAPRRRRGGKRAAPSAGAVQPVLRPPDGPGARPDATPAARAVGRARAGRKPAKPRSGA